MSRKKSRGAKLANRKRVKKKESFEIPFGMLPSEYFMLWHSIHKPDLFSSKTYKTKYEKESQDLFENIKRMVMNK